MKINSTITAVSNKSTITAVPTQLSNKSFSLAVDTGAAVNILLEDAYKAAKKSSCHGKWPLQPSELGLSWCNRIKLTDFRKSFPSLETNKKEFTFPHRFLRNQQLWTHCWRVAGTNYFEKSRDNNKYLAKYYVIR